MRGKKLVLSTVLHKLGLSHGFLPRNRVFVMAYHRIKPNRFCGSSFDDGVYGLDIAEFTEHMRWLKSKTTILTQDQLIELVMSRTTARGRYVVITFDDGYIDNYEMAFPILKRFDIPAIFFIPTQCIDERTLGWWDIIAYVVKKSTKPVIDLRGERMLLGDQRQLVIRQLQQHMKRMPANETKSLVEDLAQACDVELPGREVQGAELMTWRQIREISSDIIAIGSHTHSHRVLTSLDEEAQREEMVTSRMIIAERIGRPARSIAYPCGLFTDLSCTLAEDCGYDVGFSFNTGWNSLEDLESYRIRRVEPPSNLCMLTSACAFPQLLD